MSERVVIVGVGGLGCAAAEVLAAVPGIVLAFYDDDVVAPENLHRQLLFTAGDVDRYKVDAAAKALRERFARAELEPHMERLTGERAREVFMTARLVLDCTDAVASKLAMHDAAVAAGVDFVHAAVSGWDARLLALPFGAMRRAGGRVAGCLRCLYPDPPRPRLEAPGCAERGVLGTFAGLVGVRQARLGIDLLTGAVEPFAKRKLQVMDGRTLRSATLEFEAEATCPTCGLAS